MPSKTGFRSVQLLGVRSTPILRYADRGCYSARIPTHWRRQMKRLALLLVCCVASAASSARADEAAAMAVLQAGCTADAQRLCAGVQPGGGRILACLKDHKDSLSDQCKQAAQRAASMSSNTDSAPPAASQSGTTTGGVTPNPSAMPGSGPQA